MKDNNIVKKLVFRLIKRHIAGSTTDSAIKAALQLNESGAKATLTFLSEGAKETNKARYNINAYSQLLKQISRLRVDADVSLRPGQIGYEINSENFRRGIEEIVNTAESGKIFVWVECRNDAEALLLNRVFKEGKYRNVGMEIPFSATESARFRKECLAAGTPIKLNLHGKQEGKKGGAKTAPPQAHSRAINAVLDSRCSLKSVSLDERELSALFKRNRGYKRNLTFEVLLGYSNRRLREALKEGARISVYVPYGKDWVPYAINRLTEGKVREIAATLLDGEEKGSTDGKKRKPKKPEG